MLIAGVSWDVHVFDRQDGDHLVCSGKSNGNRHLPAITGMWGSTQAAFGSKVDEVLARII